MDKETIHWDKVQSLTAKKVDILGCLERELAARDYVSKCELIRKLNIRGTEKTALRKLQMYIKELGSLYNGTQKIGRGPNYSLSLGKGDELAFPEQQITMKDRRFLNAVCKLVVFFDGAVPIKPLLDASRFGVKDIEEAINTVSDNVESQIQGYEIVYMKDIYDAIQNRIVLNVTYPRLNQGKPFPFAPYLLKRYNSKWFVIGRVYTQDQESFDWSVIPIIAITHLTQDKVGYAYVPDDDSRLANLKSRIKKYYEFVMGFYVPTNETDPDKLPKHMDPDSLDVKTIILKVHPDTMRFVEENPFHEKQTIDDSRNEVSFNLVINPLLKQRILAFGDAIEVLEPVELRKDIEQTIDRMSKNYQAK